MSRCESADVVCPFYRRDTYLDIVCEGVTDHCLINVRFFNALKKDRHMSAFCCNKYKRCEVCQMLLKKYEED